MSAVTVAAEAVSMSSATVTWHKKEPRIFSWAQPPELLASA